MKQEDKDLLLKDLCTRLPYGVKCDVGEDKPYTLTRIEIDHKNGDHIIDCIGELEAYLHVAKPYLFPLSSMTEEQFNELKEYSGLKYQGSLLELCEWEDGHKTLDFWIEEVPTYVAIKVFDWLNKYNFDYRELIQRDLAIDATELNIY